MIRESILTHFPHYFRVKIARHPAYSHLLKLGREQDDALFIDAGCCCKGLIGQLLKIGF